MLIQHTTAIKAQMTFSKQEDYVAVLKKNIFLAILGVVVAVFFINTSPVFAEETVSEQQKSLPPTPRDPEKAKELGISAHPYTFPPSERAPAEPYVIQEYNNVGGTLVPIAPGSVPDPAPIANATVTSTPATNTPVANATSINVPATNATVTNAPVTNANATAAEKVQKQVLLIPVSNATNATSTISTASELNATEPASSESRPFKYLTDEDILFSSLNLVRTQGSVCGTTMMKPAPALKRNKIISLLAEAHAKDMEKKNYLSSTTPEGKTVGDRLNSVGYSWQQVTEATSRYRHDPRATLDRWLSNDEQCRLLMDPAYTEGGIGLAAESGTWVLTLTLPMQPQQTNSTQLNRLSKPQ